jgi:hypothetical protein
MIFADATIDALGITRRGARQEVIRVRNPPF